MIDPGAIQQVKDAMRVEEVVGLFVNLKRKGPRYLGLCPFHNEKTPSFNVSPALGIFKCFGCAAAGDAISFLEKHEHLTYLEAIRWLAKHYNIALPEQETTPEQDTERSERESLGVVQNYALKWSMEQLWETEEGQRIGLAYFRERGFQDRTIRTFQLGYVPEGGDAFARAAATAGFDPDLLDKAGWTKRREDGSAWDFFAGRVTFPILGLSGSPVAFGARTLRGDKKLPKYFNSPESVLYNKSRSLYGLALARKAIAEQQLCYLVEGYTDVISLHQAGIANVVASSGTSLTADQVRLIKRYAKQVTILYDGDSAGIKASLRGMDLLLVEGLQVRAALFPDGEDPDSFARNRPSSEVASFLASAAKDVIAFKADLLLKEVGSDPMQRAAAIHEVVESIALVPDHVLRSLYVQECSRLFGVAEQALLSEMNKVLRQQRRKQFAVGEADPPAMDALPPAAQPPPENPGTKPQERELLRLVLNYGHREVGTLHTRIDASAETRPRTVAEWIFAELESEGMHVSDEAVHLALQHYRTLWAPDRSVDIKVYLDQAPEAMRMLASQLLVDPHVLSDNWKSKKIHVHREEEHLYNTVERSLLRYKERYTDELLEKNLKELEHADDDRQLELQQERMALQAFRRTLSGLSGRIIAG
jgi:DNA primase